MGADPGRGIVGSAALTTVWSIITIDSEPVIVASTNQRRGLRTGDPAPALW